jgi:hypothetical protein
MVTIGNKLMMMGNLSVSSLAIIETSGDIFAGTLTGEFTAAK